MTHVILGNRNAQSARVVQISDCHVSADPRALYRGVNARDALEAVLAAVRAWRPDLIVASGDLSEDASEESYRYLAGVLAQTGVPVVSTPGNHDDAALQRSYFPETPLNAPLRFQAAGWRVIVLNSAVSGQVPGRLSDEMLAGLHDALGHHGLPVLIVLHHQPVAVGSSWIDRSPLLEPDRFLALLKGSDDVRAVVWGHVHQSFRTRRDGVLLLGAPSTVANALPNRERFEPDPAGGACRWLKLGPQGLETGILRHAAGSSSHKMT